MDQSTNIMNNTAGRVGHTFSKMTDYGPTSGSSPPTDTFTAPVGLSWADVGTSCFMADNETQEVLFNVQHDAGGGDMQ